MLTQLPFNTGEIRSGSLKGKRVKALDGNGWCLFLEKTMEP